MTSDQSESPKIAAYQFSYNVFASNMPAPCSVDFRWRIVWLAQFQLHCNWSKLDFDIAPRAHRNGPHILIACLVNLKTPSDYGGHVVVYNIW